MYSVTCIHGYMFARSCAALSLFSFGRNSLTPLLSLNLGVGTRWLAHAMRIGSAMVPLVQLHFESLQRVRALWRLINAYCIGGSNTLVFDKDPTVALYTTTR